MGDDDRHAELSRDQHGPRAVLGALDRLSGSYGQQIERVDQELAIAEGQLRDHRMRLTARHWAKRCG